MHKLCVNLKFDGEMVFIPECVGGAVYGTKGCTCRSQEETLRDRVTRLEQSYTALCRELLNLRRTHDITPKKLRGDL
jgi:hypothetical protein